MFRKVIVISFVFVLLLGTMSCGSSKANQLVDLNSATYWVRYSMEQVDFFTKDGERVMPNPDEHFVLVGADVIRGNLDVITYTIPAAVSGKIFIGIQYGLRVDMPANVNAITSTSMEMPEPHLIVGWFFRLPKGIWPLRLVFADGTIVNLSKN